jgi:chromosome segregation ATPase
MIRFRRTPRTVLNPGPAESAVRASRDSWRALAEQLGRRNEELVREKALLEARLAAVEDPDLQACQDQVAELTAQLDRARRVQMADYNTGRVPL